jgi:hypothetical protein
MEILMRSDAILMMCVTATPILMVLQPGPADILTGSMPSRRWSHRLIVTLRVNACVFLRGFERHNGIQLCTSVPMDFMVPSVVLFRMLNWA